MTGGTLVCRNTGDQSFAIRGRGGATVYVNVDGGAQLLIAGTFNVPQEPTCTARFNLDDGYIECHDWKAAGEDWVLDINEGMIRYKNPPAGTRAKIYEWIEDGFITGYDGTVTPIVAEDGPDLIVACSFTHTTAYDPIPENGGQNFCLDAAVTWSMGEYVVDHNIYFGTSLSDVNESAVPLVTHWGPNTWPPPGPLEPSTKYYWRVDTVNEPNIWPGGIWEFTTTDGKAFALSPLNNETGVSNSTNLTWGACEYDKFEVYFSTDLDAVNGRQGTAFLGETTSTTMDPSAEPLADFTDYYWAVDLIKGTQTKIGATWTFTTGVPISDPNLLVWYPFDDGSGGTAHDWSGYDNHGFISGPSDLWLTDGQFGGSRRFRGDTTIFVPSKATETIGSQVLVSMWLKDSFRGTIGSFENNWNFGTGSESGPVVAAAVVNSSGLVYFRAGNDTNDVITWNLDDQDPTTLEGWHHWVFAKDENAGFIKIYFDGVLADSNGLVDRTLSGIKSQPFRVGALPWRTNDMYGKMDDFRFYNITLTDSDVAKLFRGGDVELAWSPSPLDGKTDVPRDAGLSWKSGDYAAEHDVYLGTSLSDVTNATTSTPVIYKGRQLLDSNSYDPPGYLQLDTSYYWRIDEVNDPEPNSPWKGKVWRFTVADFLVVDDMEDYDDDAAVPQNMINETWLDGWWNYTGSTVYLEYGLGAAAHTGKKSMWVEYNNNWGPGVENYSQVQANTATDNAYGKHLGFQKDWTDGEVRALTIFFYGDPNNDIEPLYVALQDTPGDIYVSNYGDYSGDLSDITETEWHQWDAPLSDFSDNLVDTADVNQILIGLGDPQNPVPGGSGNMYFDDIRLYLPKCVPWLDKPDYDFSDNCIVDLADVGVMAGQWLRSDINVAPVTPPNDPVLYYRFDETSGTQIADYGSQATYAGTFFTDVNQTPAEISTRIDPGRYQKSFHFSAELGCGGIMIPAAMWTENSFSHQITVATWIKNAHPGEDPDSGAFMWEFREWDGISLTGGNRVLAVSVSDGDTYGFQDSSESASYDHDWDSATEWTHYAFVRDDSNLAVYVNGLIEAMDDSNASPMVAPGLLYLGISADRAPDNTEGLHDGFTGNLDDFKVFNYALSAPEVGHVASDGFGVILMESAVNIYDKETAGSRAVNFRDYAELLTAWLEEVLWP